MVKRKPKDPERSPDLPHNWIERHLARLEKYLFFDSLELNGWQYRRAHLVQPGKYRYVDTDWKTIYLGEEWGGPDVTAFFQKSINFPASHAGPDTYLEIDMDGGETQLSINGRPWQGIDWYRKLIPLGEFARPDLAIDLTMEAFTINYPYDERRRDQRDFHRFAQARLIKMDREVEAFLLDARFVLNAYLSYYADEGSLEIERFLLHYLEEACRVISPLATSQAELNPALKRARHILRQNIFENRAYQPMGKINICAHSHLDIVYLWPLKETLRKNCRTVTNMLSLMREFPDFRFSYSQPYLYEQLKALYPAVYEEVRQRIREGRWEVIGAMYVEPDGNLPGPESMIRQLLFGKRFIRDEFGIEAETCWLPDVFGVMYTLPQILRKCGVKYFLTAKLNIWNDTNIFPNDTFRWRGPDGSEVLAHFPPTHFAQDLTPKNLRHQWQDFREKHSVGENLFVYGLGDGGGGPTREMVAASRRANEFPGLPRTKISLAEPFFHTIEEKADLLPVWDDELYLEAHRGTYTTKGDLKKLNRQAELLYRDAEILSSMAWLYGGPFVQPRLNEGWKKVLLNQFHDTLPGTHVPEAVPAIKRDYEEAFEIGCEVRDGAIDHIVDNLERSAAKNHDLILFNTLSWPRRGIVAAELRETAGSVRIGSERFPVQHHAGRTWVCPPALPALGWTVAAYDESPAAESENPFRFADGVIETPLYRLDLDSEGNLAQIYDRTNDRDVLSAPGNVFQLFEDNPGYKFSAWDIAYHIEEHRYPIRQTSPWKLVASGPLFAIFTATWQALKSTIEQELWLYADHPRIDFCTRITWRDREKLLKVAFPLKVRTRTATYDLPFGNIERPTHRNTSWEQAKFEVCGHKWADLSEGNYGVALLNDGKYGYDARENVLRLSLLRSPIRPDAHSDQGEHTFTYSLLPHAGSWRHAQVDRYAYELNSPARSAIIKRNGSDQKAAIPAVHSLLQIDSRSVMTEVLKQSEDGRGLVLRTFDSHGTHARVPIAFGVTLKGAAETDLLEEKPQAVSLSGPASLSACYTPYEIKTHRLDFSRDRWKTD